jgi:hypothetical protein
MDKSLSVLQAKFHVAMANQYTSYDAAVAQAICNGRLSLIDDRILDVEEDLYRIVKELGP